MSAPAFVRLIYYGSAVALAAVAWFVVAPATGADPSAPVALALALVVGIWHVEAQARAAALEAYYRSLARLVADDETPAGAP